MGMNWRKAAEFWLFLAAVTVAVVLIGLPGFLLAWFVGAWAAAVYGSVVFVALMTWLAGS